MTTKSTAASAGEAQDAIQEAAFAAFNATPGFTWQKVNAAIAAYERARPAAPVNPEPNAVPFAPGEAGKFFWVLERTDRDTWCGPSGMEGNWPLYHTAKAARTHLTYSIDEAVKYPSKVAAEDAHKAMGSPSFYIATEHGYALPEPITMPISPAAYIDKRGLNILRSGHCVEFITPNKDAEYCIPLYLSPPPSPVIAPGEPMSFDEYWDRVWTDTLEERSLTPRAIAMAAWLGAKLTVIAPGAAVKVAWVNPRHLAHLAKVNGVANVRVWNVPTDHEDVPLYLSPPASPAAPIAQDEQAPLAKNCPETTGPVAWRWKPRPDGWYTHPKIKQMGCAWIDVETQGMPAEDDLELAKIAYREIEYAYRAPTSPARAEQEGGE